MNKESNLLERLGLNTTIEICRLETKNGSLWLYIPKRAREKLNLKEEKYLIAICEGATLLLVKSAKLEQLLKPQILWAREKCMQIQEMIQ